MYKLEYLPVALRDMLEAIRYISMELKNPAAAEHLAAGLTQAGEHIAQFPYAQSAYTPVRPLKHEYRKYLVNNYMMLYWVDEQQKTVTVARVVYARKNYKKLLE